MKYSQLVQALTRQSGVLVTVHSVEGSGPREVGAWMAVFQDTVVNTIGGGHLEFQAMAEARALLARTSAKTEATSVVTSVAASVVLRYALGPSLGQCCGGVVHLQFEPVSLADVPQLQKRLQPTARPVALFGGGHVGPARPPRHGPHAHRAAGGRVWRRGGSIAVMKFFRPSYRPMCVANTRTPCKTAWPMWLQTARC